MGLNLLKKDHYELINDSYTYTFPNNNTFTIFKSINDILYLIYSNKNKSFISYNIIDNKKIIEIKNAHKDYITYFKHHLDLKNKIDLVISLSRHINLKLWNVNKWECLFNMNKIGILYSACFLLENNQSYIITGIPFFKIYDLKGNIIKELIEPNDITYIVDTYFDKNLKKNFIIT